MESEQLWIVLNNSMQYFPKNCFLIKLRLSKIDKISSKKWDCSMAPYRTKGPLINTVQLAPLMAKSRERTYSKREKY